MELDPRGSRFAVLFMGLGLFAGALVRIYRVGRQVVGSDEVHGLFAALDGGLFEVLTTYRMSDPCLPYAGYFKALHLLGAHPDEVMIRAPSLVAGIALCALLAAWTWVRVGKLESVVVTWLIAISPIHVFFSRTARPYAIVVLLGFISLVAFLSWWRSENRVAGPIYVLAASLACYFHLAAAPFVLAPFAFALLYTLSGKAERRLSETIRLGLLVVLGLLLFLIPGWESLRVVAESKASAGGLELYTVASFFYYFPGTSSRVLGAIFWLLVAIGFLALLEKRREVAILFLVSIAAQLLGLLVLRPFGLDFPHVFGRYMLTTLPLLLVACSVGLRATLERLGAGWKGSALIGTTFCLALLSTGPITSRSFASGNFSQSISQGYFFRHVQPVAAPGIYAQMGGEGAILEAPWTFVYRFSYFQELYQARHRREVMVIPGRRDPSSALLAIEYDFGTVVRPTVAEIRSSAAEWLVVHSDPSSEAALPESSIPWSGLRNQDSEAVEKGRQKEFLDNDRDQFASTLADIRRELGEPDLRSDGILAWDLRTPRVE